jgi:ATP-binding cassette subfamily B protein
MELKNDAPKPGIFSLVGQYRGMILGLIGLGFVTNGLTLYLPALISEVINGYTNGTADIRTLIYEFGVFSIGIMIFTGAQVVLQTFASERVARDLRRTLVEKISKQNYRFVEDHNPAKILTNITADIDSIKQFVSQAIVSLVSSGVIIIGAAAILLYIDWRLGLAVLTIVPVIAVVFYIILTRVRKLFLQSREVIDSLNRVINESIIGAALIRVLNAGNTEHGKFTGTNDRSRTVGYGIVNLFSVLVPTITFMSSIGTLIVVSLGGYYVTTGAMSLGNFVAFISYVSILIFPILVIGFIGNIITQASASYSRIVEIIFADDSRDEGTISTQLSGLIQVENINLSYEQKPVLKDISFTISPKSKNAIIGPTAAGKTQLLNTMTGLTLPTSGSVKFDNNLLTDYRADAFYPHIGLVFQDSVLFNTTVRENIAFSTTVTNEDLRKAVETAELNDFINTLPNGLDTIVSERGTSLSGGQKQRIMLARALALDPKILFLDDFTARVDNRTEQRILENIKKNYPDITLVSITQKIAPIESYDQIILLMDGELIAKGKHADLLESSLDYQQIYNSQRSTNTYELRT